MQQKCHNDEKRCRSTITTRAFGSHDSHIAGWCRRSDRIEEFAAAGELFRSSPDSLQLHEVMQAIARGLPELSGEERSLLLFYASFLDMRKLAEGKTCVWPSNALACSMLGISGASLRRYKVKLEEQGLLLRQYDDQNRPLQFAAIDLSPLLSRVRRLLDRAGGLFASTGRASAMKGENIAGSMAGKGTKCPPTEVSGDPYRDEHLKNKKKNKRNSVPHSRFFEGKTGQEGNLADPVSSEGSVQQKDQEWEIDLPNDVFKELVGLSDRLKAVLLSPTEENVIEAGQRLFEGRVSRQSLQSVIREQGLRQAISLLLVALEDPNIREGGRFIGYMAHQWEGSFQLTPNLKRVRQKQQDRARAGKTQEQVEVLRASHSVLARLPIEECALLAWFREVVITENEKEVIFTVPGAFTASRIRQDYEVLLQTLTDKQIRIGVEEPA